ncbi:MAG: hypothetical protein L3J71_03280 [Victivallaceae bacterium]|nr:hypothetical protein [Victivallaceae bacterium]
MKNSYWEFSCPLICDELMTSSLLGARIAEDITPQPLKGMIRDSVDQQLTTNNSEFLDTAFMQSLIIASGIKAEVDSEVFKEVFDGWRLREAIRFTYRKPDGTEYEEIQNSSSGQWRFTGSTCPGN